MTKQTRPKFSLRASLFSRFTWADIGHDLKPVPLEPRGFAAGVARLGAAGVLLGRTSRLLFTARTDKGDTLRLMHRFTNGSVTFIVVAMAFVGMIMVYQSTVQLNRAVGDTQLVGAAFLKLLVRVLGPTVIGMLLACRIGAGIAAEVAAMAVTDQLDALRLCAADPIEVLMVPRLRAGLLASLALVVIGSCASALAGMLTGVVWFSMSPATYWNFELIETADVVQGLIKALAYGVAIPIVAGSVGLVARGGAAGVGRATTDAVVGCSFSIVVLDSLISLVGHVVAGA